MKIIFDDNSNKIIIYNKKLPQISHYAIKLEELCKNMQKQIDELNKELNHTKKQCELQKNQINELMQCNSKKTE